MADTVDILLRFRKQDAALNQVSQSIKGLTRLVVGLGGALLGVQGIRGMAGMVKSSLDAGEAVLITADKLGVGVEALQQLRFAAAETANMAAGPFDTALQRMTRRVAEAAQGTGEAQGALKELGLDAASLATSAPDQAFLAIADAMQKVQNQGDRVRLSFKLFDTEGVALVNTLGRGADGIQAIGARYVNLNAVLSTTDAIGSRVANNVFRELEAAQTGLANAISVQLAPVLAAAGNRFIEVAEDAGLFARAGVQGVGAVGEAVLGLVGLWDKVRSTGFEVVAGMAKGLALLNEAAAFGRDEKTQNYFRQRAAEAREFAEFARGIGESGGVLELMLGVDGESAQDAFRRSIEQIQAQMQVAREEFEKRGIGPVDIFANVDKDSKKLEETAKDLGLTFTSAFEDAVLRGEKLRDVIKSLGQDILRVILRRTVTEPLGNFISGGIGRIFGGLGFAEGGYTGPGGKFQPAGIVHAGEYVMPAASVQRIGLGTLEGMRRSTMPGYAEGGPVRAMAGGGGGTIIVNQSNHFSIDVRDTVRGEIAAAAPSLVEAAKSGVAEARMRGRRGF